MKADIYQKIELDFARGLKLTIEQVENLDARSKGLFGDRMLKVMVFLAKGHIKRLKQVIELGLHRVSRCLVANRMRLW